jgi:hypothetical protein
MIQEAAWSFSSAQYHVFETPKSFVPIFVKLSQCNVIMFLPFGPTRASEISHQVNAFVYVHMLVKMFMVLASNLSLVVHCTALFKLSFLRFVFHFSFSHLHITASLPALCPLLPIWSVHSTAAPVNFPLFFLSSSHFPCSRQLSSPE